MSNPIIVVDYNAGNLTSVMNALSRIGVEAKSSRDADEIAKATRLIFPGVGDVSGRDCRLILG